MARSVRRGATTTPTRRRIAALTAAPREAMTIVNTDPKHAAGAHLAVSGEHDTPEAIARPDMHYDIVPRGTFPVARFMHRTGMTNAEPADWKELFFPEVLGEPGS
jgi:NitT/TauT family transport system substrate-binding protein